MASALTFAIIRARRFAAATESFAIVLSAARMLLRRRTRSLPATRILAPFALPFTFIEPATQMYFGLRQHRLFAYRLSHRTSAGLPASKNRSGRQTAERG